MTAAPTEYQTLISILENQEGLKTLLSFSGDVLTQKHKRTLSALVEHLGVSVHPQCQCNLLDDEDPAETRSNKKRRITSAKRHPWRVFLQLEALQLPSKTQQHLETSGTDPLTFMNDSEAIQTEVTDLETDTVADAFMARHIYTAGLEQRRMSDRIRWFFTMILYYDLVKLMRPHGSGRIGHLMMEELIEFLGPLHDLDLLVPEETLKQMNEWSRCGMKLDVFCQEFGPGSLFYLESLISPDFLLNKFTTSGEYHEEAFNHLRELGLKQRADESQASELGQRIRHLLMKPFRVADVPVNLNDTDPEGEEAGEERGAGLVEHDGVTNHGETGGSPEL